MGTRQRVKNLAWARARYQARFSGVAFPGETYLTSYWKEGDKILIQAASAEREAPILSNAAITVRS